MGAKRSKRGRNKTTFLRKRQVEKKRGRPEVGGTNRGLDP